MNNISASLDRYIARSMRTVRGYLSSLDARLIAALLSYQDENNIIGHLCEIGVHHGRLFLMLALARRNGERALAIDLFEDDAINSNSPHAGRDRALMLNLRRLNIPMSEEEIFKTSSLDIDKNDILKRTTGRIRFFSVDACHLYGPVLNDLKLAKSTATDDAIIAVDDFFSVIWPDVSFATYDFLRETGAFVPIAITSKLYLATSASAERYKSRLSKLVGVGRASSVEFLGKEILTFRESKLKKGYESLREEISQRIA